MRKDSPNVVKYPALEPCDIELEPSDVAIMDTPSGLQYVCRYCRHIVVEVRKFSGTEYVHGRPLPPKGVDHE